MNYFSAHFVGRELTGSTMSVQHYLPDPVVVSGTLKYMHLSSRMGMAVWAAQVSLVRLALCYRDKTRSGQAARPTDCHTRCMAVWRWYMGTHVT